MTNPQMYVDTNQIRDWLKTGENNFSSYMHDLFDDDPNMTPWKNRLGYLLPNLIDYIARQPKLKSIPWEKSMRRSLHDAYDAIVNSYDHVEYETFVELEAMYYYLRKKTQDLAPSLRAKYSALVLDALLEQSFDIQTTHWFSDDHNFGFSTLQIIAPVLIEHAYTNNASIPASTWQQWKNVCDLYVCTDSTNNPSLWYREWNASLSLPWQKPIVEHLHPEVWMQMKTSDQALLRSLLPSDDIQALLALPLWTNNISYEPLLKKYTPSVYNALTQSGLLQESDWYDLAQLKQWGATVSTTRIPATLDIPLLEISS